MSRCFPYPPPGFEKNLALIESIKLPKEKEKGKKEKKKEKKREKREKKGKSRGDNGKTEENKHGNRKRHSEQLNQSTHGAGDFTKAREDESEQLERSSLTEERGCPAALQSLYDSSDSTQNSSKRTKHDATEVRRPAAHGNGLRIRLPLSRHKDAESPISVERPCFSGRTEGVPVQQEARVSGHHVRPPHTEQPCFSGRTDTTRSEKSHEITDSKSISGGSRRGGSSSHDREMRRLYKKLILDWNPPPLQMESSEVDDQYDQDWLFGKTSNSGQGETKAVQAASEDLALGSALCSWPPRACYLPEAGIYALPYVVPF